MSLEQSEHLQAMVAPFISKNETRFRKRIFVTERLALTFRFFATGHAQQSLSFSYLHLYITFCMKSNFSATLLHAFLYDILPLL